MTASIFIAVDGSIARKKGKRVYEKIKDASVDINNAKNELNNVEYVDLSYDIDQLESLYKKNNNQASKFETFASTLENMVNDYINVDKNCAAKIKSNGKNHRKSTGLAKNLIAATVCSSFDKLGNVVDDAKDWVNSVVDKLDDNIIIKSFIEDRDSWFQLLSSSVTAVGASIAIGAAISLGGIGVLTVIAASTCLLMQADKIIGAVIDISNCKGEEGETDGDSWTQHQFEKSKKWNNTIVESTYDFLYETGDIISSALTLNGLSSASKLLNNTDDIIKMKKFLNVSDKLDSINTNLGKAKDVIEKVDKIPDELEDTSEKLKDISDGIEYIDKNGIDKNLLNNIGKKAVEKGTEKVIDDVVKETSKEIGEDVEEIVGKDNLDKIGKENTKEIKNKFQDFYKDIIDPNKE